MPSFVHTEIASQPDCWQQAASLAADRQVRAALPGAGERVAFVGCGTSWFMAQSCASLREAAGQGESDAFPASEFPLQRTYDRVVTISRSGTTTEVIHVLEQLRGRIPTTVISTGADLPAGRVADAHVDLGFADERSVVQTRFATTVVALLRAHLGQDLSAAVGQAREMLARPLDPAYLSATQATYLGTGWGVGLANEAALKAREAAQQWAESYPAMEFRHGPISVIDRHSIVWIFGEPPAGLLEDLASRGGRVVSSGLDPLTQLIDAQRLAVAWAQAKGLDPDQPRGLTRSIILPA